MNRTPARRRCITLVDALESRTLLSVSGLPIRIGSSTFDTGKRIAHTADGGFVTAGLFSGKVDFDPGAGTTSLTAVGDTDVYVAKYSAGGDLQWARRFGNDEYDDEILDEDTIDIAADPERAGGDFINGVSADPALAAEYVNDLLVTSDGGVVLAGSFIGSVDFDPGRRQRILHSTQDDEFPDAYLLKLNSSGGLSWVRQFGGRFTDTISSLAIDTSGQLYAGGLFTRTVSFVPGNKNFTLNAEGRNDGFVMKLSSVGKVRWVRSFGGEGVDEPDRDAVNDIAVDSRGNVYAAGTFAGDVDFDPSRTRAATLKSDKTAGVLIKYSTNGVFQRVAGFDYRGFDGLSAVAVDSSDNVIVAGYFQGDAFDANPGAARTILTARPEDPGDDAELTDLFVEKLNGNLAMQWVRQLAGTGSEFVDGIAVDQDNSIVLSGSFYGTARFGSGASRTSTRGVDDFDDNNDDDRDNSYDAYLWKLSTSGATVFATSIGQAGDDFGAGISIGADNSILMTGRYRGTTDFDPGAATRRLRGVGIADAFVTQFAGSGVAAL
jgi:hypothetical protein